MRFLRKLSMRHVLLGLSCNTKPTFRTNFACFHTMDKQPDLSEIKNQFSKLEGGRIYLEKDDSKGIAVIRIDHVDKKNGLSGKMMVDLNNCIGELKNWDKGKGLLLCSNGDIFSSGGYLPSVKSILNSTDAYRMSTLMHDSLHQMRQLPLITATIVHGKAIGGGAELTLFSDYRIFTAKGELAFVEAKMGVGTGWGGGTLLQRLVGHSKALDILLSSRRMNAKECLELGIADTVIEHDNNYFDCCVDWLENKIKHLPPDVVHTVKKIVSCDSYMKEKEHFSKTWGGPSQLAALGSNLKHK